MLCIKESSILESYFRAEWTWHGARFGLSCMFMVLPRVSFADYWDVVSPDRRIHTTDPVDIRLQQRAIPWQ